MTDTGDRPYVQSLLQGIIDEREEMIAHTKSLDVPEGQDASYEEPTINVGDAIERSDLSYEEGNETEWVEAQQYLRGKGLISLLGGADQDGLYSQMRFVSEHAADKAKGLLN